MKQFARKLACLAMTGALALGGLAACGNTGTGSSSSTYSSAKEVVEAFEKNPNSKNFHMDVSGTLDVESSALSSTFGGTLKYTSDVDGDNSHSNMAFEFMGQKINTESYTEKDGNNLVVYSGTDLGGSMTWTKSKAEVNATDISTYIDLLSEGEFATTDNGYTITLTGEQALTYLSKTLKESNSSTEMLDSMDAGLKDAINKSKAVVTFDKEALWTGAEYSLDYKLDSSASGSGTTELGTFEGNIKVGAKITVSDYGKVDASKVKVPDNVKKDAVDSDQIAKDIEDLANSLATEDSASTTSTTTTQNAA